MSSKAGPDIPKKRCTTCLSQSQSDPQFLTDLTRSEFYRDCDEALRSMNEGIQQKNTERVSVGHDESYCKRLVE